MEPNTTESEVRCIRGNALGLSWLDEIASVYSAEALHMDWYLHADAEVVCCIKGEMNYEFDGRDNVMLKSGKALIIPPQVRHRLSSGIDAPSCRINFKLKTGNPACSRFGIFSDSDFRKLRNNLLRKSFLPFPLTPSALVALKRLGHFLHRERNRLSPIEKCEVRARIFSLFIDCAIEFEPENTKPETRIMDEAVKWLEEHYQKKVSMQPLVEHMGYGRSRFYELFKRETGLSPNDYLIRFRIRKARELLAKGGLSVKAVAAITGFSDAGFFSRTFKRLTGYTPGSIFIDSDA